MATTYTPNFNLGKQEDLLDRFDMGVITRNANIIDEELHKRSTDTENEGKYLGKTETAAAAVCDGAGGNIAEQFTAVETKFARGIQSLASLSTTVAANSDRYLKITMTTERSEFLVIAQATLSAYYYTYLVRSYGEGTAQRCRITQINGDLSCQKYIDGNTLYIKFPSNVSSNNWGIKAHTLQGNLPTFEIADTYAGSAIGNTLPAELESRIAALESAVATTAE